jgi:hypothetical protein
VETYAEDMAQMIESDRDGLIKKIIQEEEGHEIEKKNLSPESKKNQFFMLIGILLVTFAASILFFFFSNKDVNTVDVEKQFTPLIFTDKNDFVEVLGFNKEKIIQTVNNVAKGDTVKQGGVKGIYLTENKKVINFKRFVEVIRGNFVFPHALDGTSFIDDHFLIGVVNNKIEKDPSDSFDTLEPPENLAVADSSSGKDFFLLLKVRSSTDVFASLRAWENKMFLDLYGLFGLTLSSETSYLLTKDFDNGVVQNRNARILYDNEGEIVMMYIFADDNSIVITNTKEAAREIILRLASSEIEK